MRRSSVTSWNFSLFVLVSFYSLGSGLLESLLNYPSWYIIGPTEAWPEYRQLLTVKIIPLLAVPALLFQTITNIILIARRPAAVPRWTGWLALSLLIVSVVSSATIQIPIQAQLNDEYSKELVDKLIFSDIWLRVAMGCGRTLVVVYMLHCVTRAGLQQQLRTY